MKQVLELIEARTATFRRLPIFAFMADGSVPAELRLPHAPQIAHFVLSFADMCRLVLREEPARDWLQEIVNAHTDEDGGHWQWYMHDLSALGLDREMRFSDALKIAWGRETDRARLVTYRLCRLGMGASALQKVVLLICVEACARTGMEHTTKVAREVSAAIGKPLPYMGAGHLEAEDDHTMGTSDVQRRVAEIALDEETRESLYTVVNESFDAYTGFVTEMLENLTARAAAARAAGRA